jgi:hypothetical protein
VFKMLTSCIHSFIRSAVLLEAIMMARLIRRISVIHSLTRSSIFLKTMMIARPVCSTCGCHDCNCLKYTVLYITTFVQLQVVGFHGDMNSQRKSGH